MVPAFAVTVASPGAIAVILPVAGSTVATSGLSTDQTTVSVQSAGATLAFRPVYSSPAYRVSSLILSEILSAGLMTVIVAGTQLNVLGF